MAHETHNDLNQLQTVNNRAPVTLVENKIIIVRGEQVIIDKDLDELYGVT